MLLMLFAVPNCIQCAPSDHQPGFVRSESEGRVPGEYLVTLEADVNPDEVIQSALKKWNPRILARVSAGVYHILIKGDPGPEVITDAAKKEPRIKAIQPNYIYTIQ
jgi:hypothetical protein